MFWCWCSITNSVIVDPTVVEPEDNPPIKNKCGRRKKVDSPVITQGNSNDSEVEDRYPNKYRNFKCVLYTVILLIFISFTILEKPLLY